MAEARSYADRYPDDTHPLFLTLPGPAAHDVQLLIEEGLLELTETGAVSSTHQFRVVCVEQDGQAVTELNRRFPGMKIIEASFENLISWQTQFNWPSRSDRRLFCARIVNLDLNRSFVARRTHDIMVFPILEVVRKLLEIHTNPEPIRWTLCLTLHAETPWSSHVAESARTFMCENLDRDTQFRLLASSVLTNPFIERLFSGSSIDFMSLDRVEQQRFLMVFLPKKIAQLVQNRGWRLVTKQNLRYGTPPHAPMATWMLEFIPQESLISTPDTAYRQALHGIFQNSTRITAAGGRAEA
ncbi:hypothetical protein [Candidatus Palauibacter sp.]|uniref:hypothetical protein n=1 Tax=Candidatus Palauibacter sp. TaxID=3101350 RepID=UPI003CC57932